ncbi:MAG: N-acetylmuramate alpha-1-phosphate uridylyltransferase [Ignavibacteria bacterium]|nr:N-acetylmuramate alpha-1-phosphate uridylyltransferase [Ignavibacteria bacterium]
MKGIILSAGYGTRLLPLTETKPKALVEYKNAPMIHHQILRLQKAGVDEILINVHHHAKLMHDYFKINSGKYKADIILKEEKDILGTGGGILNFHSNLKNEKCFFVINVDIETDFKIEKLYEVFENKNPLAVLAVQKRHSARKLEFTKDMKLTRRQSENSVTENLFAFNGMHLISGSVFRYGFENKLTDIFDVYFELMKLYGDEVYGCDTGAVVFKDLGKKENL